MKPEEIAAYIGAAAWLPQIFIWVYHLLVKTKLKIIPEKFASIGYTSFGPIFNIRMALLAKNRDLIVDGIDVVIRHEDGDSHQMQWSGLAETFSEITDLSGNKQTVGRDQTPIAIKVGTNLFLEKLVRFQEPAFISADATLIKKVVGHFNFLKQARPDSYVDEVLNSKEMFDLIELRKKWFWWKPGKYEVDFQVRSPDKFYLDQSKFSFELSKVDLDDLLQNGISIEADLRNTIRSNLTDFKPEVFSWKWVSAVLMR